MKADRAVRVLAVLGCVGAMCASAVGAAKTDRVRFVKLSEVVVAEKQYVAMVVKPTEGDGQTTLLIPRTNADMLAAARKLRPDQVVAVRFVEEAGRNWLNRFEAIEGERKESEGDRPRETAREGEVKREGDKPREAVREGEVKREGDRPAASPEMVEIREMLRKMNARMEAMEREVRALRAENARLRGERPAEGERKDGDREREVKRDGEAK